MTLGMLLGILGLAIAESLNPSALVVTISLLSRPNPATKIAAYAAGIFAVFCSLGIGAVLGGEGVLTFFKELRDRRSAFAVQIPIGLALLMWAAWSLRRSATIDAPSALSKSADGPLWLIFLAGIGVTMIEALTAFPYFGAIALLLDAGIPKRDAILAIIAFNLLFITPPLLLLWITSTLGRRAPAFLDRLRAVIEREGRAVMLWLFIAVGIYLTLDGVWYFA